MSSGLFKGIAIGVAVTVIGGLGLLFSERPIDPKPSLVWLEPYGFTLTPEYLHGLYALPDGSKPNRYHPSTRVAGVIIENRGNAPARGVQLIFDRPPIDISSNSPIPLITEELSDGRVRVTMDSVPPSTQVLLDVFGYFDTPTVLYEGVPVERSFGDWIELTNNEWRVRVWPILMGLVIAAPLFPMLIGLLFEKRSRDSNVNSNDKGQS